MEANELKTLQQMIRQLGEQNNIPDNQLMLCSNDLKKIYKNIDELHKEKDTTAALAELKTWYQSNKLKISLLKDYSSGQNDEFLIDIMINIAKGVCLAFSKVPRYHQMICLWFNLHSNKTILEVKTGQGKTIIVAMTALYFALRQKKVDVFTSSSNLAMTETNHGSSVRKLFDLFNISLADVCRDRLSNPHLPYASQVIYGTAFEFQADYLTKVFNGDDLFFKDRNFDQNHVAILDEVDALLIDRMRDSTRLSSPKPLFECIKTILILIHEIKKQLVAVKMKFAHIKQVKILGEVFKDFKKIQNMSIQDSSQIDEKAFIKHQKQQIQEIAFGVITSKFKDLFPNYLISGYKSYIEIMLPLWIDSIYQIEKYKEDVHFRFDRDTNQIVPIDISTGTYQKNTKWMNGVHQFLEIQYKINPSIDSLVTNYESNLVFFKRYRFYLYGLTGTIAQSIGEQTNKDSIFETFLKETYRVNIYKIPTAKKRLLQLQYPRFFGNNNQWKQGLYKDSMLIADKRMVLIIFQTIKLAKQYISNFPKQKKSQYRIIELHDHDRYFDSLKKQRLDMKKTIIVATNLGGRGTDIEINDKDILTNGGLYVMMTYFATNWRIEEQAFGRAARNGQPGSGAFYIDLDQEMFSGKQFWKNQELCRQVFKIKADLRTARQQQQFKQAKTSIQNEQIKNGLLEYFYNHYLRRQKIRINQLEEIINSRGRIISNCKEQLIEFYNLQMQRQLVEEQWGIYLKKNIKDIQPTKITICFDDFRKQYTNNRDRNDVNPGYFAIYGSKMFNIDKKKSKNLFDLALQKNQNNWVSRYYKLYFKLQEYSGRQLNKSIVEKITADIKHVCQIIITEYCLNTALAGAINSNLNKQQKQQQQLFYVDIITYLKTIQQSLRQSVITKKLRIKMSCRMELKNDISIMLSLKGLRHTIAGFQITQIKEQKKGFFSSFFSGIWAAVKTVVTTALSVVATVVAAVATPFVAIFGGSQAVGQIWSAVGHAYSKSGQYFVQFLKELPAIATVGFTILSFTLSAGFLIPALLSLAIWAFLPPQISHEKVQLSKVNSPKKQTKLIQIIGIGQLNQDAMKKMNQLRQKFKNKQKQRTKYFQHLYQQLKGLDVSKDKELRKKIERKVFSKKQKKDLNQQKKISRDQDIKQQKKNEINQIFIQHKILEQISSIMNPVAQKEKQLRQNIQIKYEEGINKIKSEIINNIKIQQKKIQLSYLNNKASQTVQTLSRKQQQLSKLNNKASQTVQTLSREQQQLSKLNNKASQTVQTLSRVLESTKEITQHNLSISKVQDMREFSSILQNNKMDLISEKKINQLLKQAATDVKQLVVLRQEYKQITNASNHSQSLYQGFLSINPSQEKNPQLKKVLGKFHDQYKKKLESGLEQKYKIQEQEDSSILNDQLNSISIETQNKLYELSKESKFNPVNKTSKINEPNYYEFVVRKKCLFDNISYIKAETQESVLSQIKGERMEFIVVFKKAIIYQQDKNTILLKIYEKDTQKYKKIINEIKEQVWQIEIVSATEDFNCGRAIISDINNFIIGHDIPKQFLKLNDLDVQKQYLAALVIEWSQDMIANDDEYVDIREKRKQLQLQQKEFLPNFMMPFELGMHSSQFKQFGNKLNDKICQLVCHNQKNQLLMYRQLVENVRNKMESTQADNIRERYPQFKIYLEQERKRSRRN